MVCFVSGVRLYFYFMLHSELIYFLISFHCLHFFSRKIKNWFFYVIIDRYWRFNAFSGSFPIQFECVISIVAAYKHTHKHVIPLLISFSISLSEIDLYAESASFHCCCGLAQLKYCYYYYWMLCMCVFSIISLIKSNFYRDEKCVDSNFMFILLLMTRFESIKREDKVKRNNNNTNTTEERKKRTVRALQNRIKHLSIFLSFFSFLFLFFAFWFRTRPQQINIVDKENIIIIWFSKQTFNKNKSKPEIDEHLSLALSAYICWITITTIIKNYLAEKWNWPTNEKKVFSLLDIHISMDD